MADEVTAMSRSSPHFRERENGTSSPHRSRFLPEEFSSSTLTNELTALGVLLGDVCAQRDDLVSQVETLESQLAEERLARQRLHRHVGEIAAERDSLAKELDRLKSQTSSESRECKHDLLSLRRSLAEEQKRREELEVKTRELQENLYTERKRFGRMKIDLDEHVSKLDRFRNYARKIVADSHQSLEDIRILKNRIRFLEGTRFEEKFVSEREENYPDEHSSSSLLQAGGRFRRTGLARGELPIRDHLSHASKSVGENRPSSSSTARNSTSSFGGPLSANGVGTVTNRELYSKQVKRPTSAVAKSSPYSLPVVAHPELLERPSSATSTKKSRLCHGKISHRMKTSKQISDPKVRRRPRRHGKLSSTSVFSDLDQFQPDSVGDEPDTEDLTPIELLRRHLRVSSPLFSLSNIQADVEADEEELAELLKSFESIRDRKTPSSDVDGSGISISSPTDDQHLSDESRDESTSYSSVRFSPLVASRFLSSRASLREDFTQSSLEEIGGITEEELREILEFEREQGIQHVEISSPPSDPPVPIPQNFQVELLVAAELCQQGTPIGEVVESRLLEYPMDDFLKAQASLNSEITLMRDNLSLLCDKRHILDDEIEKLQSYIRRVSSDSSASLDMIETAQGNRKIIVRLENRKRTMGKKLLDVQAELSRLDEMYQYIHSMYVYRKKHEGIHEEKSISGEETLAGHSSANHTSKDSSAE